MQKSEFDQFADEYRQQHAENVRASGYGPEHFAEYKIVRTSGMARRLGLHVNDVLDFGCGVGNSVPFLGHYFAGATLHCADVSERSLEVAAARFPGRARWVSIEERRLPISDASVDLAFVACVLHHVPVEEHVLWLGELRRVVRPGGLLAVFEHNPWNPLTVRAVDHCPFDANAQLISMPALKRKVRGAGWTGVRHQFQLFFPRPLAALLPFERLMTKLPIGAQYVIFAVKQ